MDSSTIQLMQQYVACPKCKGDIRVNNDNYICVACGNSDQIRDGVFSAQPSSPSHYFDKKHSLVELTIESPGTWDMFYEQQSRIAAASIRAGDVVVDVGCGSELHFEKPKDCVVIGVDPSFDSLTANRGLDLRIHSGAEAMPLKNQSVDRMFFFYSVHHMVGQTTDENTANLASALRECGRVIRSAGSVVIFDMSPWWFAWHSQKLAWNRARGLLEGKLNMFFWRRSVLERFASRAFAAKTFECRNFRVSPFHMFQPVFNLPNLKVPRLLYPFDVLMYKWSF